MPPRKPKQNASAVSNAAVSSVPTVADEQSHTPEQDPRKKVTAGITQAQKQALVDNLQLEITDRARKLRAQYALQAQGLRARLELRVNRIPYGLKKRKMQDLVDEHAEKANPKPAAPLPVQEQKEIENKVEEQHKTNLKRQSDQISTTEDEKENESQDLPNPKKRAKTATATTAKTKTARTASRAKAASATTTTSVLSPRSHNSRTLPRSPFKPGGTSPEKSTSHVARAMSPAKAQQPAPARGGGARTASRQQPAKKNARDEGRSSEASNTSASTTIVTKTSAKSGPAPAKKTTAPAKATAASKRPAAAAKKETVQPTSGGRSLRKRN